MATKRFADIDPFEPVIVLWEDAMASGAGQADSIALALASYRPCMRKTIGMFVGIGQRNGREALLLAMDDDRTAETPETLGGLSQIPIGMVISCNPVRARRR